MVGMMLAGLSNNRYRAASGTLSTKTTPNTYRIAGGYATQMTNSKMVTTIARICD